MFRTPLASMIPAHVSVSTQLSLRSVLRNVQMWLLKRNRGEQSEAERTHEMIMDCASEFARTLIQSPLNLLQISVNDTYH